MGNRWLCGRPLLDKWGYTNIPLCPWCQSEDTAWHRIYKCPHAAALRQEVLPQQILDKALAAGPKDITYGRGLCAPPRISWAPPSMKVWQ